MTEPLLKARDLAELLGFSAGTILDWTEKGDLPAFKVGGRLRFRESEVLAWLEARRVNGPGAGEEVSPAPTAAPTRRVLSQASPVPMSRGGTDAR